MFLVYFEKIFSIFGWKIGFKFGISGSRELSENRDRLIVVCKLNLVYRLFL